MGSARRGLADGIASLLGAPCLVLVTGPVGSGRSATLHDVASRLEARGVDLARIAGRDAVDGIPLAPVAPLLTALGLAERTTLEIYTALPRLLRARGTAVLIDDIDAADHATGVLAAQCARAGVPLVVTSLGDLPAVLRDLGDLPLHHRPLPPLSVEEVAALAEAEGHDPLDVPSLARLVRAGRGLPGRVVELIAAGAPDAEPTPAGLRLGPGLLTETLRREVGARLAGCLPQDRAEIDTVCVVGRFPEDALDPAALDRALASGLLRLEPGETGLVVPGDDVVRAVVVEDLGTAAVRAVTAAAQQRLRTLDPVDAAPAAPAARAARAVRALLDVAHGCPVPDDVLREAATEELRCHRAREALDLLAALGAPSPDPETLLVRGRARAATGDALGARDDLRQAARTAAGELLTQVGRALGVVLAIDLEDPAAAVAEVGGLLDRLPREAVAALEVDLVKWRLMAGAPSDRAVLPRAAQQALDDADRIGVALIEAMVASLDGPLEQAAAIVTEALPLVDRVPAAPPHSADLLALSGYLAAVFAGDLAGADARATAGYEEAVAREHPAVGMWEYARAEFDLHLGLLGSATARARRAVHHLAWRDVTGLHPTARALLAALEARQGRGDPARDLIATLPAEAREDPKVVLHLARVEAALEHAARPGDAARLLREAADRAAAQSHTHLALLAYDEALMVAPSGPDADGLASLLAREAGRSRLMAALADRATALVGDDAAALERAAGALADLGMSGRSAHALEIAAERHRDRGSRGAAERCRDHAALLRRDGRLWPPAPDAAALSPREREIALLASRGLRSRDVAERLGLSVRTVDNHLTRIYTKLGVRGRSGLAAALGAE
ncbi:LuxR C-terminal-related transcriptional regulator [Nocardioides sp.]|uniref:LuxR C-terminal-related transcriptional regulator n=1 Tax=Nocardioides sp. TaxID=35761 RepID=UPI00351490A4